MPARHRRPHRRPSVRNPIVPWIPVLLLLLAPPAAGQTCPESTLDNFTGAGVISIPGFVSGEEGAAVFEADPADYPLRVERVRIAWSSILGGAPQSLEGAVKVYEGTPPAVTPLFELVGPVLSDGFLNEFELGFANVVVNSGPFTVALSIANTQTTLDPSMVIDGSPCAPGQNFVLAIPGGWTDCAPSARAGTG